jgi:hypothetical protein
MTSMILVELPASLRLLAGIRHEVRVSVDGAVTQRAVLDALETSYPVLQGTIRDRRSKRRRPFIRFFACQQDLSHMPPDDLLPEAIGMGKEAFLVVGAIAGG